MIWLFFFLKNLSSKKIDHFSLISAYVKAWTRKKSDNSVKYKERDRIQKW